MVHRLLRNALARPQTQNAPIQTALNRHAVMSAPSIAPSLHEQDVARAQTEENVRNEIESIFFAN